MAGFCLSSVILVMAFCYSLANEVEPTCSKLIYDKQMLETMVRLEAKMNQWDRERKVFEESVLSVLGHRREEMDQKFKKQNENLNSMLENYNEVREEVKKIVETRPKIAFNAYFVTSDRNYGAGHVLLFSNVLLNEGGGYDKNTGVFTAPVSGLYQFNVHICNVPAAHMVAAIVHESVEVATTSQYENVASSCSSVTAPVLMKKGERVHAESAYASSKLRADSKYKWPSFTGVLLSN